MLPLKRLKRSSGVEFNLEDYQIQSVTEGEDALGDALVKISDAKGTVFAGRGLSTGHHRGKYPRIHQCSEQDDLR